MLREIDITALNEIHLDLSAVASIAFSLHPATSASPAPLDA